MWNWRNKSTGRGAPEDGGLDRDTVPADVNNMTDLEILGGLKKRGDAFLRSGRLGEARDCYRKMLQLDPNHSDALINLGYVLIEARRFDEARAPLEKAVRLVPDNPDAQFLVASTLQQLGQSEAACRHLQRAVALRPDFEIAYPGLVVVLFQQNRVVEATQACETGLKFCPDSAELHYYRGDLYKHAGDLVAAILSYRQALAFNPGMVAARYSLSKLLFDTEQFEDALTSYLQEIALTPENPGSYHQAGVTLRMLGRPREAVVRFEQAAAIAPQLAAPYYGLGSVYQEEMDFDAAQGAFEKALALEPDNAEMHQSLGEVHQARGARDLAIASYERVLTLKPDYTRARWSRVMVHAPAFATSQEIAARERALFANELSKFEKWWDTSGVDGSHFVGKLQPFFLSYQEEDNLPLLKSYGELCARAMDRWYVAQEFADRPRPRGDRIRIGIVSADVRMHSVWMAIIKGWLEHANRVRFEVGVFCLNTRQDAVTNWARSHSDFFVAGPKSLYRWVDAIRTENPDVLLFPAVGLEELTLQLASLRLAAVQMNAWGHPETSGLPTIDYYLSGESFEPAQAQKNYTEQLVLLPHLGNTYEALRVPGTEADLRGLGIDPERPIVLCPGSPFKYQPEYDPIFIEVARRVTCCQFVFFNADPPDISNRLRARLVAAFAQAEMSFDTHACFIPRQSIPEYHALLKRADVLMDTIGFSGYNNVVQALECGLPVVTREGRFLRGRLGSGVLRCAGLTELIAETEGEYVDLAARLLLDPVYRESVRRKIVEQRGILFDDVTPMRRLEALLESAVAKHAIQ